MEIAFRRATHDDVPALWDAIGPDPSDEQLGMMRGNVSRGRRFRRVTMSGLLTDSALARTTVAVVDGTVVGFLQAGPEMTDRPSLRLILGIIRAVGPLGIRDFLRRERARARTAIPAPESSYHIAEMHVLQTRRNLGVGAALLAEAEREARSRGYPALSLTTSTTNPARRLYERAGLAVVETREDAEYRDYTGVSGRVLMVKHLS